MVGWRGGWRWRGEVGGGVEIQAVNHVRLVDIVSVQLFRHDGLPQDTSSSYHAFEATAGRLQEAATAKFRTKAIV